MRKHIHISLLLLILLFPTALAYLFFAWQKHQVKEAVKAQLLAGMDASELTELKFSRADAGVLLEWEEEREFEYRGQMYDVVDVAVEDDSIRYLCYRDHAESRLKQELKRLLASPLKSDPATADNTLRLITFFQSLFCVEKPSLAPLLWGRAAPRHFCASPTGLPSGPPPVPPPEV